MTSPHRAPPLPTEIGRRILIVWVILGALLLAPILPALIDHQWTGLTDLFLVTQDLPVFLVVFVLAGSLLLSRGVSQDLARLFRAVATATAAERLAARARPASLAFGLAILCILIGWGGAYWVYDGYALSLDEFAANFGAVIHARGEAMAVTPPQWRPYLIALQPLFVQPLAGGAYWSSAYLPMNAILRGAASLVGARALVSPILAGVSVIAVFGVARRLWPEKPAIAVTAAVLLATSSQVLVVSMTAYAMTAHLALNLVWLWLFLRGGRLDHLAATGVGFVACGLHQLVFHPLFVTPFVLQLWLDRRWRLAGFYTGAYGAMCLFWIEYWPVVLHVTGAIAGAGATHLGNPSATSFATNVQSLFADIDPPSAFTFMDKNLIRLVTWQNLLTAPLVVMGFVGAVRAGGPLRSLALGMALTTVAAAVLLPYQGHGWGYRYVHGLLGSVCLLSAWEWARLTDPLDAVRQAAARGAFVFMAAISLLILFPVRAWQAHSFLYPYARAAAAIAAAPTQIVLVDHTGVWFGVDLVRNDPYLHNRPLVFSIEDLKAGQARDLCRRFSVSLFARPSADGFGIRTFNEDQDTEDGDGRSLADLRQWRCGAEALPVNKIRPAHPVVKAKPSGIGPKDV